MQIKSATVALAAAGLLMGGCGSGSGSSSTTPSTPATTTTSTAVNPNAKEKSPPGDIPDSTAFVPYKLPAGGFSVKVPEGWSRTGGGKQVTFTSNLNSVTVASRRASGALTVGSVTQYEIPALARTLKGFKLLSVATIPRSGERAVRIRYLAKGQPNSVTGKASLDAAERYLFVHNGTEAVLTLAGPKGADNVDPWRTISDSVRWTA
jgi:hypothetical protein